MSRDRTATTDVVATECTTTLRSASSRASFNCRISSVDDLNEGNSEAHSTRTELSHKLVVGFEIAQELGYLECSQHGELTRTWNSTHSD
jgi:hypothetical protein